jgi:hypothetical protein
MNKKFKKILSLIGINFFLLFFYSNVFALTIDLSGANPISEESIIGLINKLVDAIITIGSVIVVFFVIYSGFLFVTAQGKEDQITKAKSAFFWAVIGGVVLLGAKVLSGVICTTAKELGASNLSC